MEGERDDLKSEVQELRSQLETVQTELETCRKRQPATEIKLLEPAEALNRLKAKRKKSKADLADVETLWAMR